MLKANGNDGFVKVLLREMNTSTQGKRLYKKMEIKPNGNNGFINNLNDIIGLRPGREMTIMKNMNNNTTTLRIRHEANLTSYGVITHGNRRPLIAVDLHKTFNSIHDFGMELHVDPNYVSHVLNRNDGRVKRVGYYEHDENGNRIGKKKWCRISYAAHYEDSMNAMMECGREAKEELDKANKTIDNLKHENTELHNELHKANTVIYGLRNENEALRKENEKIAELERKAALWDAYEERQEAKRKAREDIENYKRLEEEAIALRQESEKKLAELMKGDGYVA